MHAAADPDRLALMTTEVIVTSHAMARYTERFPGRADLTNVAPPKAIADDVTAALAEGRRARRRPRWAALDGRLRNKLGRSHRFVWTADELVAYVVARSTAAGPDGQIERWHVVTVLNRSPDLGERIGVEVRRTIFDQLSRERR